MKRELSCNFNIKIAGEEKSYPFTVPGSVMTTFVENSVIPHPFYERNEYEVKEFLKNDFEIRGEFLVSHKEYEKRNIELLFDRIDTVADIFLNQHLLAHTDNMHRSYCFPCKEWILEGKNTLIIKFFSPLLYIENYPVTKGREISMANTGTLLGEQYLRKAHCMFGWDWGPQLPDMGIYGNIQLQAYDEAKLMDTLIRQKHEDGAVTLFMKTEVAAETLECYTLHYEVKDPQSITIYEGECPQMVIKQPKLWWPNGYGEQPLYKVIVSLHTKKDEIQRREYNIGLRTLTVSQEEDTWGKEFAFMVNGVKIFARGADYIPDDCFYPAITREILKRDVDAAVFANFNALRVWGGGFYPTDDFYDLCDAAGIILWQDFMFACNVYDVTDAFVENIVAEAKDNLIRFRNHASLGLICGNNEMEIAWLEWTDMKDHAPSLRRDYLLQFEYYLANAVKEVAPDVFYWPSSPSSGGSFDNPGDENRGDSHYWDVWHGQKPYTEYQNHFFRFCSEFGFQSLPSIKTIDSFTKDKDRNLFSRVMESHQKNPAANGKILYYLSETFQYPKNLKTLAFLSQVMQGYAIKSGVEHWRRNRGRCMGSIYWQFNDNWPVASWSSMDYYGRYKALHYMAREFYAPVAGSIQMHKTKCAFWISNETLRECSVDVTINLKSLDFTVLDTISVTEKVKPLSAKELCTRDYKELIEGRDDTVFVTMEYRYVNEEKENVKTLFETFVPIKYLKLEDPHISVHVEQQREIAVKAVSFVPYCQIEAKNCDLVLENNFFAITGSEEMRIALYEARQAKDLTKEELSVYDVYHTYA